MPCEAGDPGWRGRLISHAPRLGRPEVNDSPPPVYAARSPAPLTRGKGGAPLRTGDNICPHAPRLRGRQSIRRGDGAASDTAGCKSIRRGEERAEPRSVRAGINRGSERAWASGRNSVAMAARSGDPGGRRVRPSAARRAPEGAWPCKWRQHRQSIGSGDTGRGGRLSVESLPPPQL